MSDAIVLEGLRKTFGTKVAVDNLTLTVGRGQLVGLIGPNGAGKTTTIRMVMSILFPDHGRLEVLGKKSAVLSKDRIGYLPEERGVYRKMRVGDFIIYMARLKGVDAPTAERRAKEWVGRIGLGEAYSKKCMELSKGMQQKVQFISAIIHEPDLLILDEPFSGLDPVNARLLRDLIDQQHRAGRTIIFSTHQMYQAEALCDRVVMIHQGVKRLDMTPAEMQEEFDPRTLVIEPHDQQAWQQAQTLIANTPGVQSVQRIERALEVALHPGTDASAVLGVVAGCIPCRRAEVRKVSLEDIFIDIVQGNQASAEQREQLRQAIAGAEHAQGPGAVLTGASAPPGH